jgi:hypothetical protein
MLLIFPLPIQCIYCPSFSIFIIPAPVGQIAIELSSNAGIPPTSTLFFPFSHIAQEGTHGIFVILQTPNGPTFSKGTQSVIFALSFPPILTRRPGVVLRDALTEPMLHFIFAPFTT